MIFSKSQIEALFAQQSITDEWPWSSESQQTIDKYFKDVIAEARRKIRLLDRTEYGHYGSGYASFVECWFYRDNDEFKSDSGNFYWGLLVLFSRLSKYYVMGEGSRSLNAQGGAFRDMPYIGFVDNFNHPAVKSIVGEVGNLLDARGLERLRKEQLSKYLPKDIHVPTALGNPPWCHFDALFYWED
jgi:hypothetical protein